MRDENEDITKHFTTPAAEQLKIAGFFGKLYDVVTSPQGLRTVAIVLSIATSFTPLPYAIGIISTFFTCGIMVYGAYNDIKRMRVTREAQKELSLLKEIDTTSNAIEKMVENNPMLESLIHSKKFEVAEHPTPSDKEVTAWHIIAKTPELGICLVFSLLLGNPVAAGISFAAWFTSNVKPVVNDIEYSKTMIAAENTRNDTREKRGLIGYETEDLSETIIMKRAQLVALKVVEKEKPKDLEGRFLEVYNEMYDKFKKEEIPLENPSWFSDIKSFTINGFSAAEASKFYVPDYIPPQFQGIVQFAANPDEVSGRIVQEHFEKEVGHKNVRTLLNIVGPGINNIAPITSTAMPNIPEDIEAEVNINGKNILPKQPEPEKGPTTTGH